MISRFYTWQVSLPTGRALNDALEAAGRAAGRVAQFNPHVLSAEVYGVDDDLMIKVHFTGRDQWWIKKRVVYAIGAILAQSKIDRRLATLVAVARPEDRRSTRPRASDGRHNPLPDDMDIDHTDLGLETV